MNHAIAFSDKWDSAMTPVIAKYKERALIILVCAGRRGGDHAGLIAEERLSAEMTRRGTWRKMTNVMSCASYLSSAWTNLNNMGVSWSSSLFQIS